MIHGVLRRHVLGIESSVITWGFIITIVPGLAYVCLWMICVFRGAAVCLSKHSGSQVILLRLHCTMYTHKMATVTVNIAMTSVSTTCVWAVHDDLPSCSSWQWPARSQRWNKCGHSLMGGGGGALGHQHHHRLMTAGGHHQQSLSTLTNQHRQLVQSMMRMLHVDGIDLTKHPLTNHVCNHMQYVIQTPLGGVDPTDFR